MTFIDLYGRYKISTSATAEYYINTGTRVFGQDVKPRDESEKQSVRDLWESRREGLELIELELSADTLSMSNGEDKEEYAVKFSSSGKAIHLAVDWYGDEVNFEIQKMGENLIFFKGLWAEENVEHTLSEAVWEKK